jgi:hypothetical protein
MDGDWSPADYTGGPVSVSSPHEALVARINHLERQLLMLSASLPALINAIIVDHPATRAAPPVFPTPRQLSGDGIPR